MTIRKDSYEVFYINFSLVEKLQNLPDGSQVNFVVKWENFTECSVVLVFVRLSEPAFVGRQVQ